MVLQIDQSWQWTVNRSHANYNNAQHGQTHMHTHTHTTLGRIRPNDLHTINTKTKCKFKSQQQKHNRCHKKNAKTHAKKMCDQGNDHKCATSTLRL